MEVVKDSATFTAKQQQPGRRRERDLALPDKTNQEFPVVRKGEREGGREAHRAVTSGGRGRGRPNEREI